MHPDVGTGFSRSPGSYSGNTDAAQRIDIAGCRLSCIGMQALPLPFGCTGILRGKEAGYG